MREGEGRRDRQTNRETDTEGERESQISNQTSFVWFRGNNTSEQSLLYYLLAEALGEY